ncbi:MAG: tetratricopeptide repeat protein [bacterium]
MCAQWSDFKKGLRKEIQVAVESDTMLVAHYNAINFSFIVTTNESHGSDIYREESVPEEKNRDEIWRTTERFWERLRKKNKSLKAIFREPFLASLRHPASHHTPDQTEQISDTIIGASATTQNSSPKSMLERINDARGKGDFELASLLLAMFQEENNDASDSTMQAERDALQKSLEREKALLRRLYDYALAYEQDENWQMAAAVYENLLVLGEFKDARTRLLAVLPRLKIASNSIDLQKKYKEGLIALQAQDWLIAMVAFENIIEIDPNYRNAYTRLKEAQAALAEDDESEGKLYSNGHTKPGIEENRPDIKSSNDFILNRSTPPASDLEALYDQALQYINRQDWRRAYHILNILESENPSFKSTIHLRQLVEKNLAAKGNEFSNYWIFGLMSAIVLLVGFSGFSPMFRAGLFALVGQHQRAVHIYEKLLFENPAQVRIYQKLGVLYLKIGLQDGNAIRVFTMIKRLNLRSSYRQKMDEQLESLLANHVNN